MLKKIYLGLAIFFGLVTILSLTGNSQNFVDDLVFGTLFTSLFIFLYWKPKFREKTPVSQYLLLIFGWLFLFMTVSLIAGVFNGQYANRLDSFLYPILAIILLGSYGYNEYTAYIASKNPAPTNRETEELTHSNIPKTPIQKYQKHYTFTEIRPLLIGLVIPYIGWAYLLYRLFRHIAKNRYFASGEFLAHKARVDEFVTEYNEIASYANTFKTFSLQSDSSDKYKYARQGAARDISTYNMTRNRYTADVRQANVHQCSLQVVRNAELEPYKYLCKYFDFKPNEPNLNRIEEIGEMISRFENTVVNLDQRLDEIKQELIPPAYILKYYADELYFHLNLQLPHINFEYPLYKFQYVSAGGNSGLEFPITLDAQTVEELAEYMSETIQRGKTVKAQRALMTRKLREYIKQRDHYTCQQCGASTAEQSLLLLEVDHIIPVSKGGLSTEDNLQTLCWKCNRSKSDKIIDLETM